MATSERTRPVVAVAIVVALVVSLGGWWWSNRDTTPRAGDRGQVTARVERECVGLRFEFKGVLLSVLWGTDDFESTLPAGWRGREVVGTVEVTERDGPLVVGTFTAEGTEVPVRGSTGDYFSGGCRIWPEDAVPAP